MIINGKEKKFLYTYIGVCEREREVDRSKETQGD